MRESVVGAIVGAVITGVVSLLIFYFGNFSTQKTIEESIVETLSIYFDSVDKDMTYEQALQVIYEENENLKKENENLKSNVQNTTGQDNINMYREDILKQAEIVYKSEGIESAITILSEGLQALPEDDVLLEKISEYSSYIPIALFEKQIFYQSDAQMIFSHREDYSRPDNVGNMYSPDAYEIYASNYGGERSVTFILDKQYTLLTGTLAIRENNSHESIWLEFYEGDRLLGETDVLGDGIRPIDFEINVSGATELTIKSKTNTSCGFAYTNGFYIQ